MSEVVLPLVSLIAGAAFGLVSSLVISSRRQRYQITLRLVDQYLAVRREVVEAVSNLTHLSYDQELGDAEVSRFRDETAKLFYKHYDFLPRPVLEALLLLHVNLGSPGGNLFGIDGNCIRQLTGSEVTLFIEGCSVYRNARLMATLALKSRDARVRTNQSINLHARHVLYTLNRFASLDEISSMVHRFKKVVV